MSNSLKLKSSRFAPLIAKRNVSISSSVSLNPNYEFKSDNCNEDFEDSERDMISAFNDYCSDHMPTRDEEIDMNYHWQIEDQRLAG
jgi:hypothetical protein